MPSAVERCRVRVARRTGGTNGAEPVSQGRPLPLFLHKGESGHGKSAQQATNLRGMPAIGGNKFDAGTRLNERRRLGSGTDLLDKSKLAGHKVLEHSNNPAVLGKGNIGSLNGTLLCQPVPFARRRGSPDLGCPIGERCNVKPVWLHEVSAKTGGHRAAPVEVMHEPGIVPGKAGPALLPTLGWGTAAARNMGAVARPVDRGVAKAPHPGHDAQAQG